jgi:HAE1 family hydrophobic/amphiphilic exporter-1
MLMIILGLVVLGYRSLTELQVDRYPAVDFPFVSVITVFPGAGPEDVEDLVVVPIEDAVAGIPGIDQLASISQEGVGVVVIAFEEGVDGNQAAIEVERQVATVGGQLPTEAFDPSIIKADINAIPIMEIILSGPQGQDALSAVARDDIKPRLQTIRGVAAVSISGGREGEIQVEADPAKLAAYGIPLEVVQQALVLNNLTFPAGSIEEGRQRTSVRSVGEFTSLEEIENVVVAGGPSPFGNGGRSMPGQDNSGLVLLRDVATVEEGFEDQSQVLRFNGEDAVNISVIKSSDANAVEMADSVHKMLEELRQELPAGAEMTIVADDSEFTRESVAAVQEDLILAVLVTGLVMLVFLHTIRSTFIVLLAIPTSLISTFLVMWVLGFSLNVLTLLALTLTIGILVDDSVVVLENIERHLKMKKKPKQAALDGRAQIGLAAITITLVDVAIYVPVAFTSGIIGQFFRSYGITIATAVLFSLFVSFTLTPMLASLWMKDESQPESKPRGLRKFFGFLLWPVEKIWSGFIALWEWGFGLLTSLYAATIRFVLRNFLTQSLAVLVAAVAVALGVFMVISGVVGTEAFPQEDDAKFTVNIEMPAGTNLAATDQAAREAERIILEEVPETISVLTRVGSGGSGFESFFGGGGTANTATILVQVVDKNERERTTTEIVDAVRPEIKKIPESNVSLALSSIFSGGAAGAVEFQIFGEDPDALIDLANEVEAVMRTVPGTVDVLNTDAAQAPEARLIVDRDRALDQGLSPAQVAGTLRSALSGADVGTYKQAGATDVDIVLSANERARSDLNQLLEVPMGYRNGQPVKLGQVASIERDLAPAVINRTDRQRTLSVTSGVSGRASGDVTNEAEAAIQANVEFPEGYGFQLSGQSEGEREIFADLTAALGLGILLVYMLLVALFQSWLHPLAIMFSLPVALVGAFGGLWLFGHTLNMMSMLGIILLAGIVTKNAILLVDFTNELRRKEGYNRKDALVEAGRLRLRPILMTTAAIVFAMLPILLGRGAGAESRAPLAAVIIGGNITSTLLTLILVPVVYNFFDGGSGLVSRTVRRILGGGPSQDETAQDEAPAPRPAPQPQPGPAASLSRPAPSPGPDAA